MTIAGALILFFSLGLLAYWFRYTCVMILDAQPDEASEAEQARTNHLSFAAIREKLRNHSGDLPLESLRQSLEQDYRFVRFLLRQTGRTGGCCVEARILMLDYHLMRLWYRMMQHSHRSLAYKALEEMSGIIGYLVRKAAAGAGSFQEA